MLMRKKIVKIVAGNDQTYNKVIPGESGGCQNVGHVNQRQPETCHDMYNVECRHNYAFPPFQRWLRAAPTVLGKGCCILEKGLNKGEKIAGEKKENHNETDEPGPIFDSRITQSYQLAFIHIVHLDLTLNRFTLSLQSDVPIYTPGG